MNNPMVFVNGEFIPASEASLLVNDLAIQRGYGIFDFLKTIHHVPIFADEHIARFLHSARQLRLSAGRSGDEVREIICRLMEKNNMADSGIKLILTGGYSQDGYTLSKPNLVVMQSPLPPPAADAFEKGIRLVTYPHIRQMPDVKTIDYLMAVWLQPYIRERDADDVLYHREGVISECPRSNFFVVLEDDTVVTPSENILNGVIRGKVLELAGRAFKVSERPVLMDELWNAREAFVTSTTKHIIPVLRVDGRVIGEGLPGRVSRVLREGLDKLVDGLTTPRTVR
jgi:branched-chain amino acid aminotransferase